MNDQITKKINSDQETLVLIPLRLLNRKKVTLNTTVKIVKVKEMKAVEKFMKPKAQGHKDKKTTIITKIILQQILLLKKIN